jgi:hypothetical protein
VPDDLADYEEIVDGDTRWRFDRAFLASGWTCIWGRGCKGIEDEAAPELGLGCCSVGAHLGGVDEARYLSAMAAMIPASLFEHGDDATEGGIFSDDTRTNTRVVDGACIFLNRPGHPAGAGCALHLAALAAGEPSMDWKPSVCWQLPIRVDWSQGTDGTELATVRRWRREDWGDEGATMAWCCTEEPETYAGDRPVVVSMGAELEDIVGAPVYVELRRRLGR